MGIGRFYRSLAFFLSFATLQGPVKFLEDVQSFVRQCNIFLLIFLYFVYSDPMFFIFWKLFLLFTSIFYPG